MKKVLIDILCNGVRDTAEILFGQHWLEFKYHDLHLKKEAAGRSDFYLLKEIRRDLEPRGIYLLCKGSRYDVDARGMHAAYILKLGSSAHPNDVVRNIFDTVEDENMDKIKRVEDQEKYKEAWCKKPFFIR